MVLKALASELYRAQRKVHELEDRVASCQLRDEDRLRRELQEAQRERDQLRRLIDARKEPPPFRRNFKDR
ncbi:hypothetical protein [Desulfofustis limnaeus]|uniref:Uncharacterized protein n=1 Tax=Desulfofustis limnaeus TaxID=2740163 RepID=A0ABM7WER4_9BACT|nr:hypothetical protein [Desulfofustis limnaeus]MDX9894136.1 hypothetical protein [Desulfofustis sp.]BDD89442.1 hypothetical protein DPPLL_38070 [Desulfofustis limnaeus]